MLRQFLLLTITLIVGVGGGLGAGYAGLNPQVNELIAEKPILLSTARLDSGIIIIPKKSMQVIEGSSSMKYYC